MKCRCCGSINLQLALSLGNQPWGNDFLPIGANIECEVYPLELFFCSDCNTVQIGYTIPKEKMFVNHTYLSGTTNSLRNHFAKIGQSILDRTDFLVKDYILDIGGNDGTFLEFFRAKNIIVLNVDSGKLQAEASNSKNVHCINTFFNKETAECILADYGQARVIHGSGIFFHLEELHSVFDGVKHLLSPDGMLVAEFIYLPEMVRQCAYDQIYHEHLLYYSLSTFQTLLNKYDLEIYDACIEDIHGGSCIAYATHKGTKDQSQGLRDLVQRELDEHFDSYGTYTQFRYKVEENRRELVSTIHEIKEKGLRIQALGAPVKGSTIINYCKLTESEIDCGVEINTHKCNTYYPGTRIPVYHQDAIPEPDVYLLLAWNFRDEILPKFGAYKKRGGKILIPVPTPRYV